MLRRIASTVLVVLVAVIAAAFVMEWGVRVLAPQALPPAYMVPDPDLGLRVAANVKIAARGAGGRVVEIRTNAAGLRMDEAVELSASRRRIMVYGGASAFGAGLPVDRTFVHTLGRALQRRDPVAQLLNAAAPGYTTGHTHLQVTRHADTLAPARAMYFLGRRTLEANARPDRPGQVVSLGFDADGQARLRRSPPYPAWERLLLAHTPYAAMVRHAHLRVLVRRLWQGQLNWRNALRDPATASAPLPVAPLRADDLAEALFVNELLIGRLAELCERAGLPLVLVWVPEGAELDSATPGTAAEMLASDGRAMLARTAADTPTLAFIDSVQLYRGNPAETPPAGAVDAATGQFTASGAAWFAALIEDAVMDALAGRPPAH